MSLWDSCLSWWRGRWDIVFSNMLTWNLKDTTLYSVSKSFHRAKSYKERLRTQIAAFIKLTYLISRAGKTNSLSIVNHQIKHIKHIFSNIIYSRKYAYAYENSLRNFIFRHFDLPSSHKPSLNNAESKL